MIHQVPKEFVSEAWPYLAPVLARALDKANGERTLDDVRAECSDGSAQLWFHGKSALVTELIQYPRQKVARLMLCAGDLKDAMSGFDDVKAWAKREGCAAVEICGRRGWIRALDMDETYTVARSEL